MKRSSRGQLTILALLLLPFGLLAMVAVADLAVVVITKARLQVTADRAALAAGGVLAQLMNRLGELNWKIHHEWLEQEREFTSSQQQSEAGGQGRVQHRQEVINALRGEMEQITEQGYAQACAAALAVVEEAKATPWAEMIPLYGGARVETVDNMRICQADRPLFSFYNDQLRADQWPTVPFTYPNDGADWSDPGSVADAEDALLQYRFKAFGPDQQVAFALRLRTPIPPGLWNELLTDQLSPDLLADDWLAASAAAQPIDGSIEALGMLDAETPEAMTEAAEAEGLFYEPTLVPLDRLQQRALGYQGLRSFDPTEGWMDDEAIYLQ